MPDESAIETTSKERAGAWLRDARAREGRADYHGALASADLAMRQLASCDMREPCNQIGAEEASALRRRCISELSGTLPVAVAPATMQERHIERARSFAAMHRLQRLYERDDFALVLSDEFAAVEGEVAAAHMGTIARLTTQRDKALRAIADIQDAIADPETDAASKLAGIAAAVKARE